MQTLYGGFMGDMAIFSDDRKYRYRLRKHLSGTERTALFVMLNPSVATEFRDDNTIRRCKAYAADWGYGILEVVNIFAIISTDPKALYRDPEPIGPDNNAVIRLAVESADIVVCAWGSHGDKFPKRVKEVLHLIKETGQQPHYLELTKSGQPRHPLKLKKGLRPKPLEEDHQ